jgi:hypothetical protein
VKSHSEIAQWNRTVKLHSEIADVLPQNFGSVNEPLVMTNMKIVSLNVETCGQFNKHFTSVTYNPSKISFAAHRMHAPMQCFQNALAMDKLKLTGLHLGRVFKL